MVVKSQILEVLFEEKTNNLIMLEHASGFDEYSILVPSSSYLLKKVEQFGSSMECLMLLEQVLWL